MSAWLDDISLHPIFASTSSASEPIKGRSQRIALVRKTELLVACGKQLRITHLTDVKARHGESNAPPLSYKTITSPVLDFDIRLLVVNPSSRLVAIIGDNRAAVLVLPRSGWHLSPGAELALNVVRIDSKRYHGKSSRIVQALWHSWSTDASSLLIMTEDGCVREYDVSSDTEGPQQTMDLRPAGGIPLDTTFDADEEDDSARAFCIGQGSGWGALTLYGLLANGSITAICPYAPKNSAIPADVLENLSAAAAAEVDELTPRTSNSTPEMAQRRERAEQLQLFIASLQNAQPRGKQPRLRGPYHLQPAPRQLRGVQDSSAAEIMAVRTSTSAEILLVAHNDGRVNVLLDLETGNAFLDPSYRATLVTYETLDTDTASLGIPVAPTFLRDESEYAIVTMQHAAGVQSIDLPASLHTLLSGKDAKTVVSSAASSEVTWLVRVPDGCAVTGSTMVNDVYLGDLLVTQLQEGQGFAVEICPPSHQDEDGSILQIPARAAEQKAGYVSVLREPAFAPIQIKLSSRVAISGAPGTASTTTLHEIGSIIESIRNDVRQIVDATNIAQDRLRRQLTELPRQLAKLQELQTKIDVSAAKSDATRIADLAESQHKLLLRTDRFLQRVMRTYAPGTSDAERAWFAELAKMRGELERGMQRRKENLEEGITALRPRVQVIAEEQKPEGRLGERQIRAVETALREEARLIDSAKLKVESLSTRVALAA